MSTALKEKMVASLKAARAIADRAKDAGRNMTEAEVAEAESHLKAYEADKALFAKAQEGADLKARLVAIGVESSFQEPGGEPRDVWRSEKSAPARQGGRGAAWAAKAGAAMQSVGLVRQAAPGGLKALLSGTVAVPNLLDAGAPVEIDSRRLTLLDLVGRGAPSGERIGNDFTYLRQTTRLNNAAAIADGRNKPTSEYSFGEVKDHYRTYVNKTEDLPYRYLSDFAKLMEVVEKQLAEDTMVAIERDMLAGTGPDEAAGTDGFVGILETAGVQVQTFDTDLLTTLSNAKHKFISQELPFNGWVLHPADLQRLEMMRENGATGKFLFGSRAAVAEWLDAPIALSAGMPAGKALMGDFSQAEIIPVGDDELVVDTNKRTTNNTFLLMFEGRYGFRVKKPVAFIEVATLA